MAVNFVRVNFADELSIFNSSSTKNMQNKVSFLDKETLFASQWSLEPVGYVYS